MKRFTFFIIILTSLCINVHALEVDVDEVRSKKVKFTNYRGKNKKIDPVQGIMSIGTQLGRGAKKVKPNRKFHYHMKYSIVRAISSEEPEKLSADIFSLDKYARVDHIKNVRRITTAYLVEMYNYTYREAKALSLFITYYNANYRGDMEYLSSKYKKTVLKHLNRYNAGISTKYYEWPGRTRLIIPLIEDSKRDKLKGVDPDIISGKKIRDKVRKDDSHLDERKDLVELKEKKISRDKEQVEIDKEKIEQNEADIKKKEKEKSKRKDDIKTKKEDIKKKEDKIEKEKKKTDEIKSPAEKRKKKEEIKKEEKRLAREKKTLREKEKKTKEDEIDLKKKKKKVVESKKEVKKEEEKITEKEKKLDEEKKEIVEDESKKDPDKKRDETEESLEKKELALKKKEEELDKREDKLRDKAKEKIIYASKLYYLKIREYMQGGHYNNELYMINPATRKIIFKSPIDNICGKRYDIFAEGIVVITHLGNHKSGHRLTLLDRETLEVVRSGTDDVFWRSFVEIRENHIYAIMSERGKYYLGKYDMNFKIVARSNEWINENTFITFFEDYIYINSEDKKIMVLNKKDLSLIETISP